MTDDVKALLAGLAGVRVEAGAETDPDHPLPRSSEYLAAAKARLNAEQYALLLTSASIRSLSATLATYSTMPEAIVSVMLSLIDRQLESLMAELRLPADEVNGLEAVSKQDVAVLRGRT